MPYRVSMADGSTVECDTVEEVRALSGNVSSGGRIAATATPARRKGGKNPAVKQLWADAKKLAKKEGITVVQARSKLAKARKKS